MSIVQIWKGTITPIFPLIMILEELKKWLPFPIDKYIWMRKRIILGVKPSFSDTAYVSQWVCKELSFCSKFFW